MKTLYNIARWHFQFEREDGAEYKLDDRFHSRYARLIMAQEPDLDDFFDVHLNANSIAKSHYRREEKGLRHIVPYLFQARGFRRELWAPKTASSV